jgi:hypothetical protein
MYPTARRQTPDRRIDRLLDPIQVREMRLFGTALAGNARDQRHLMRSGHALDTPTKDKDSVMHTDLHDFLVRLARTIAMSLAPVAFIAFVTMPASLHHHIGASVSAQQMGPQHMT